LPILDGRVHEQVSSVLFFTVFFEGERHDLSKTGGFGRKMPPPPGKPVTFYDRAIRTITPQHLRCGRILISFFYWIAIHPPMWKTSEGRKTSSG